MKNSSHAKFRLKDASASPVNTQQSFSEIPLFSGPSTAIPGALDDANVVRGVLVDTVRRCSKSREQIVEVMGFALNQEITVRQLNSWTAESREDCRFPAEFDRAFCYATGDDRLLRCRAELAGYKVIGAAESDLMELGRQYLIRQRAAEQVALLEKRLQGRDF
jgi:hypothetical protein